MAQRRMFSKSITNSSQFLMMPQSSQNLYFHLGMNADDDGFCEHFAIMRMTDSKPDDLKVLQAKNFVTVFDDKVLVVVDWKENNYLRNDRYTPSKYLEIYKEEIRRLSSGIPQVYQVDTQVRLGKDRLGEVRKGKNTNTTEQSSENEFINLFKEINPTFNYLFGRTNQREACKRLLKLRSISEWAKVVTFIASRRSDRFCPRISTPIQLEQKYADLETYASSLKEKLKPKIELI